MARSDTAGQHHASVHSEKMNRREAVQSIAAAGAFACVLPSNAFPQSHTDQYAGPANQPTPPPSGLRAIWTNQCGYLPTASKSASVVLPPDVPGATDFTVVRSGSADIVLRGTLSAARLDSASGDIIALADFSALQTPGTYQLHAAGVSSDLIPIGPNVYAEPLRLAMRSFYGQRCGHRVNMGGGYKHGKCHKHGEFHPSSGRSGKVKQTGGWHDAGDYGRYVVNSGISTGTLLWTWELFPGVTRDLKLAIPESGGATPDFLAEIRWNLNWMLSMQDAADGGVWHKQTSEHFCGFILPTKDKLPSEVIGTGTAPFKSTGATADLAAVLAIAARCYQPYDTAFAQRCLAAARAAYRWAQSNPAVPFKNPSGIATGEYGNADLSDELLWAAAELYRTTGEAAFATDVQAGVPADLTLGAPGWGDVMPMALWTYCLSLHDLDPSLKERILGATRDAAEQRIQRSATSGYGNTLAPANYTWGSNGTAANDSLLLLLANRLQPSPAAREAALANLHYLLGRNCFGVSWVTHVGLRPFQNPHHRPSVADKIAAPWPGLLSGGPNAHGGDAVANALSQRPPMRHWVDDWHAYSLNEVAINWNAPLVFALAAANDPSLFG